MIDFLSPRDVTDRDRSASRILMNLPMTQCLVQLEHSFPHLIEQEISQQTTGKSSMSSVLQELDLSEFSLSNNFVLSFFLCLTVSLPSWLPRWPRRAVSGEVHRQIQLLSPSGQRRCIRSRCQHVSNRQLQLRWKRHRHFLLVGRQQSTWTSGIHRSGWVWEVSRCASGFNWFNLMTRHF